MKMAECRCGGTSGLECLCTCSHGPPSWVRVSDTSDHWGPRPATTVSQAPGVARLSEAKPALGARGAEVYRTPEELCGNSAHGKS